MPNTEKPSALTAMADRMNLDPKKLQHALQNTYFKGCNEEELMALVVVANEHKLNPFCNEIYAFPAPGGGIKPMIGIDGWISIMNRHPLMNGGPFFGFGLDEEQNVISCACTIHIKGRAEPVVVTEFMAECKQNSKPWNQMPRRMLRHAAMKQCARIAFGISGLSIEDDRADELPESNDELRPVFGEVEPGQKLELFGDDSPPGAEMEEAAETVEA